MEEFLNCPHDSLHIYESVQAIARGVELDSDTCTPAYLMCG